jgi:hypothetical protein
MGNSHYIYSTIKSTLIPTFKIFCQQHFRTLLQIPDYTDENPGA